MASFPSTCRKCHHVYRLHSLTYEKTRVYKINLFNQLSASFLRGIRMLGSRGSKGRVPFLHVRKYRSENHGKDRTILRSHQLHRWARIPSVCRHLFPYQYQLKHMLKELVSIPIMTNHSGFWTRSSSFWGSRRVAIFTFSASLISSAVRCRMKTGLPRHLMITCIHQYSEPGCRSGGITYVLALGDCRQVNLDLGHGQNIRGSRHGNQEICVRAIISNPS
jgi:hypothetical protein